MQLFPTEGTDPHARKFGVEIECGLPGGVDEAWDLFPDELDDDGSDYCWSCHEDGSGVELATPPLQGEAGFRTLRRALTRLRDNDGFVTDYDGLHVHHDAPEFVRSPQKCLLLVKSWINNLDAIHEMVAPRRRTSGACPSWGEHYLRNLEQWASGLIDGHAYFGRNDLNLSSLAEHGTIEIRLHEGTLDPDVAEAWIRFGQVLIHETLQQAEPIESSLSDELFMSRIRLSPEALATLAAKKQQGYHTPASGWLQDHPEYDGDGEYDDDGEWQREGY